MHLKHGYMTPEEAVRRAFWMVMAPSLAFMLAPWLAFIALAGLGIIPRFGTAGLVWFLAAFIVGFAGGWLVWSVRVPRWRLWAYSVVDDIGALKDLAVERQIIWPEGSLFERTELASEAVRQQLRELEHAAEGGARDV